MKSECSADGADGLLPCPFCGADSSRIILQIQEPHTHHIATFMPDHEGSATIECGGCCVGMIEDNEEKVIAAWNRRASHECGSVPDQIRQQGELLARIVWQLDRDGYIQTYDQDEEEKCDYLRGMAMQCVSVIRASTLGMQPPATVEQEAIAKPDSVHLAVTSAGPESRVEPEPHPKDEMELTQEDIDLVDRIVGYKPNVKTEKCPCAKCRPVTLDDMRMIVCPNCGNKRCPRASDHTFACTGSNEPGQMGSAYSGISSPSFRPNEQAISFTQQEV